MTQNNRKSRANLGLVGNDAIERVNQRLKDAGSRVRVRLNGKVLGIRATLPLKSGYGKKQQDIRLGIPATREGLKQVENRAHHLDQQLILGTFKWSNWERDPAPSPEEMTVSRLIEEFKPFKMRKSKCSEETWKSSWMSVYEKLPQNEPLTEENVIAVVSTSAEDSRNRQIHVQKLQALCKFAGLNLDLQERLGEYEPEPREIPSDELIEEWRDRIPNPAWRWVYGVISTFGIRSHEVFFCDLADEITLQVHKGKTGPRVSHAIRPEWVERWNLMDRTMPSIHRKTFKEYGQAVSLQFGRYNLPFVPYDLRHAWAIRASVVIGLPNSVAADLMGHSVAVHTKTYHRWLSADTNRKVYMRMVLGIKD